MAPLRSPSLLYKCFLQPLLTYASPGLFPFLSVTNIIKLERLHRAASRAITGCLSSFPIPLLSEASLLPLWVTLTHIALSSYERALCLSTSFPILGWSSVGVEATQGALILLDCWSEYWCLPFNRSKCKVSFSVEYHQANFQPHLLFTSLLLSHSNFLFLNMYLQ